MKLENMLKCLPHFTRGEVVKGFGRGSKELGIPTANFPESVVENLPKCLPTGIYYGWAKVGQGDVHKMVMSIGWNPYYHNEKKSMMGCPVGGSALTAFVSHLSEPDKETHIIHKFASDFYGSPLSVVLLGFIRGEQDFSSLDDLISAINNDISIAKMELDKEDMLQFKTDPFFNGEKAPKKILDNGESTSCDGSHL